MTNQRVVLAARPRGELKEEDFRFEEVDVASPAENEVLVRTMYLSLDPYMRGRMSEVKSYAPSLEIGQVMPGGAIAEVVESRAGGLRRGDIVATGNSGWQQYAVVPASGAWKVDASLAPLSAYLGVLGMPGLTAYTGLINIGQPKPGETVVVAAAAGAVGSVVGQVARIKGCRAVGIAGGEEKCAYVTRDLRFDVCVDHRSEKLAEDLAAACPNGIDVYFENVGGKVFEAVLPLLNPFARVPVCGLIAYYNVAMPSRGIDRTPMILRQILVKRLTFRGFIVSDFAGQQPQFAQDMAGWVRDGKVRHREHIVEGFEKVVAAFQGLFRGENVGKLVVKM